MNNGKYVSVYNGITNITNNLPVDYYEQDDQNNSNENNRSNNPDDHVSDFTSFR